MSDYHAPLEDFRFLLNHVVGLDKVTALAPFSETTADVVDAILEESDRFNREVLQPLRPDWNGAASRLGEDGNVHAPAGYLEAYAQFVENGWQSLAMPGEFDGQGLPYTLSMPFNEMVNATNMAFGLCPLLTCGAFDAIEIHGTADIKSRYLPKMVDGAWTGTMNLTEPQAGSDLAAVKATATPDGDHYLVRGQKIYITWGDHEMAENVIHLVLARLPDAPQGIKGISLFLVPKYLPDEDGAPGTRNDVKAVSLEEKLGIHASPTCVMSFGENGGAVGYLIGQAHNGMACMFTMMNHARLEVGLQGVGVSEGAYQHARSYAAERVQGRLPGVPERVSIDRHADVQRMLLQMRSMTEAMRGVALMGGVALDLSRHADEPVRERYGARFGILTPVVKAWCTEWVNEVASLGIQVHGGMGFVEETGAAQFYRDARICAIYEGTNGIQANDLIGRKLIRDEGRAFADLQREIQACVEALATHAHPTVNAMSGPLDDALQELQASVRYILDEAREDFAVTAYVSFNFLMQMGTVCGAWVLAQSAMKAVDVDVSDRYRQRKLVSARFYLTQVLPRAGAYHRSVVADATLALSLEPALL